MNILEEIAAERRRQVARGYDATHDDAHVTGEIAMAGAAYALHAAALPGAIQGEVLARWRRGMAMTAYPWPGFAPKKPDRALLITALALLVAEVERLDRAERRPTPDHGDAEQADMFWLGDYPEESFDSLARAVEESSAPHLDPIHITRAARMSDLFAVRVPIADGAGDIEGTEIETFPTREGAEAYIASLTSEAEGNSAAGAA